ncbi:MAG: hypothetical protein Q9168_002033 [Polycauliona sp. 1 TL-2023]
MLSARLLESISLERQPCCIAFSLTHPEVFIVGTYNLSEPGGISTKHGSLIVYHLQHGIIKHLQTILFPFAILDLRFSPLRPQDFAFATSVGTVGFGTLLSQRYQSTDALSPQIIVTVSDKPIVVADPEVAVTSLAFTPSDWRSSVIAVSMSDGSIALFDTEVPGHLSTRSKVHHLWNTPIAAWVVAWFTKNEVSERETLLYTGGDDSALCRHTVDDMPIGGRNFSAPNPSVKFERDSRIHSAGVTAMIGLCRAKDGAEYLLTGSYDESVRVICIHESNRAADVKAKEQLNGGVWQMKLFGQSFDSLDSVQTNFRVLASCMHAGCKVIEVRRGAEDEWTIEILAEFMDAERINPLYYASDVQLGSNGLELQDMTFVSTSFYDKKMWIWKVKEKTAEDGTVKDERGCQSAHIPAVVTHS